MKSILKLMHIIGLLISCSGDDEKNIDCALYDPAFPQLFLRLEDAAAENLIENGTIDPENINVNGDFENASFRYVPPNDYAQPDNEMRALDHSLALSIAYAESFKYQIQVEDFDPIEIDFSTIRKHLPCGITLYLPQQA
ncbi:hypothetical protein [Zunongwangia pacifica]|uniref:Uncharacterized protein n=1 Tax=Zunongwangia pacifica TaxID=2911062 RepID=A0A9X1ZTE4_9FLAO|nr:hypothetical protein [Zunongwangia pacifica]MCL6220687.1 hypothetical protein [Zunongwangia pacifica]